MRILLFLRFGLRRRLAPPWRRLGAARRRENLTPRARVCSNEQQARSSPGL